MIELCVRSFLMNEDDKLKIGDLPELEIKIGNILMN